MNDSQCAALLCFISPARSPLETALLPVNSIFLILTFGPSSTLKVRLTSLGPAGSGLSSWVTVGVLVALGRHEAAHDAFDLPDLSRIDERVETDEDVLFLQLLLDLGLIQLLAAGVVDDLDPLPLLQLVEDALAHHAVVVGGVEHFDGQVVEEVGGPQPLEVLEQAGLGLLVVRHPHAVRGPADLGLDVIEVGPRLDHRDVALRGKRDLDEPDQRRRPGRRQPRRGDRRLGRRRLGRRRLAAPARRPEARAPGPRAPAFAAATGADSTVAARPRPSASNNFNILLKNPACRPPRRTNRRGSQPSRLQDVGRLRPVGGLPPAPAGR